MLREVNRIQNNIDDIISKNLNLNIITSNMYPNGAGRYFLYKDDYNKTSEKFTPNIEMILPNRTFNSSGSYDNWYYSQFRFSIVYTDNTLYVDSTFDFKFKNPINSSDNFRLNHNYDIVIDGNTYNKIITVDPSSHKFKLLFKDISTYLPNSNYKCIEMESESYLEFDVNTFESFNIIRLKGYLVENGDFITPYVDPNKLKGDIFSFVDYNTSNVPLPLTKLVALNYKIPQELIDYIEKKLLNYIMHNIFSSNKILKYLF